MSRLDHARAVADAVLWEGYLLYPYRASSSKNQVRWQFGVLGPPGALDAGVGEDSTMAADCLVRQAPAAKVTVRIRFLQLQTRTVEAAVDDGTFEPVPELVSGERRWLTWDEAVECEESLDPIELGGLDSPASVGITVAASREVEQLLDDKGSIVGRLVRVRHRLDAILAVGATPAGSLTRLSLRLANSWSSESDDALSKDRAIAHSFIGTHALVEVEGGEFVSTVDPPDEAVSAAAACTQHRWWPTLAGPPEENQVLLVSPIIVEDHAELAPESSVALFDATEIDEILTLRVLTMTDEEKADARATDPRAAEIIDRCEAMSPEDLQGLHGALRNPHPPAFLRTSGVSEGYDTLREYAKTLGEGGAEYDLPDEFSWQTPADDHDHPVFENATPWWDPAADASVAPESDAVLIAGVPVSKGSLVTVQPSRRADAQDIFYTGMQGKVAAVLHDVDGDTHVAITLLDDPAAEMHEWYGRFLYFAPDELVPVTTTDQAVDSDVGRSEGDRS